MATSNPFDLLGDDDAEDPSLLIAAQQKRAAVTAATKKAVPVKQSAQSQLAKLPSKPLPPAQAVKEARSDSGRGGGHGGGRGYGRGRVGFKRDEGSASLVGPEEGDAGKSSERRGGYGGYRGGYRGGRRGGPANSESDDGGHPRRVFERHSGTGRGNELKREGSGHGNWGTRTDELVSASDEVAKETEKSLSVEKPVGEEEAADANKENPENEPEEKKPEDKEMTLEEYEKLLEEKRKSLQALKTEERKVDAKQFETMQPLVNKKKGDDDVFIKLVKGSDKDKRKEAAEKDEKSKKSVSINEFLKPADGEKLYVGGHGRGRGRGSRGGYGGRDGMSNVAAPPIEDPRHFPTLGGN